MSSSYSESWVDPIFDAVVSDVQRSGYFKKVQGHEPKSAPKTDLTAAVWVQAIRPLAAASGLASTSAVIAFWVRGYSNMLKEPQDAIDPQLVRAMSNLFRRYHDDFDFDLDALGVRNVDVFGTSGIPMNLEAGYLEHDKAEFRIMDLTVPVIVNDVWAQTK